MSDFLKDCTKSVLEKMNLFVVLQIAWIIEFHVLGIFSAKHWFYGMTEEQVKVPAIIGEYSQKIVSWMDIYKDFVFFYGNYFNHYWDIGRIFKADSSFE